jgi:hypothetical protein
MVPMSFPKSLFEPGAAGSMSSGPFFQTLLTRVLTIRGVSVGSGKEPSRVLDVGILTRSDLFSFYQAS